MVGSEIDNVLSVSLITNFNTEAPFLLHNVWREPGLVLDLLHTVWFINLTTSYAPIRLGAQSLEGCPKYPRQKC
jgi:hypothetical protein